jgi:hypothetical protein
MNTKENSIFSIPFDYKIDTGIKPLPIIQEAYSSIINSFADSFFNDDIIKVSVNPFNSKERVSLQEELKEEVMIAGGCLSDHFIATSENKEYTFKDIDFFISSKNLYSIGLTKFEECRQDDLIYRLEEFLKETFPDAINVRNKFQEFQEMYEFVSYRLIFGMDWKGVQFEFIFYQEDINIENFDLSFRKFYYRGENIICYKSSLEAIEKKELSLLNFFSVKNSFFRIEKFNKTLGYNLDFFSKVLLFLSLRDLIIQKIQQKSPWNSWLDYSVPADEFIKEEEKRYKLMADSIISPEKEILIELQYYTQHFDIKKSDSYSQIISECKNCFDSLPLDEQFDYLSLFNHLMSLEQHLNTAKERFVYYLENQFNLNFGEFEVSVNEFNDNEIWNNEKIFNNITQETLENALSSYKKKLKLERLYNPGYPNSNFYSYFKTSNDVDKNFSFLSPSLSWDKSIEILERLLSENLTKDIPFTRKQKIMFSFKPSELTNLISGESIYSTVSYAEDIESNSNYFCFLQWSENDKNFSIFSNGYFLYFDTERLKLISDAFQEKLGYPVFWRPVDIYN